MYRAIRKQVYESEQAMHEADSAFFQEVDNELGSRQAYVESVRDNAMRANRFLAKFDPTGVGARIVKIQGSVYAGVNGYEEGGVLGAVGAVGASHLDTYTQGFASQNYRVLSDYYAKGGSYKDENGNPLTISEALQRANLQHANSQWNPAEHARKIAEGIKEGDLGKVFDGAMDMGDAKNDLTGFAGRVRGAAESAAGKAGEAASAVRDITGSAMNKAGSAVAVARETGRAAGESIGSLRNAIGGVFRGSEDSTARLPIEDIPTQPRPLDDMLTAKKQAMEDALAIKNPAQRADAVKKLYDRDGMSDLGQLERMGHIETEQARQLNDIVTREVDDAVSIGTQNNIQDFQKSTGIKVEKVMLGDSGSSGRAIAGRSVSDCQRSTTTAPRQIHQQPGRRN
jgi:hypothetical protein